MASDWGVSCAAGRGRQVAKGEWSREAGWEVAAVSMRVLRDARGAAWWGRGRQLEHTGPVLAWPPPVDGPRSCYHSSLGF